MYAKLGNIFTPASASSDNFAYLYPNTKIFMKKSPITTLYAAGALVLSACSPSAEQNSLPAPHLEKRGNVTQLIVEGKPYLALACELGNSSSSSLEYMEPYWPQLKEAGVNTVLAVVSWEQVEPAEGSFDFSVLDGLISEARAHDLKLSILWFGSWKNGMSSYHPIWVKENPDKFPLAQTRDGDRLPILSTLGTATRDADAKAFAAMMKHIREVDSQEQTVVMIQVENEVGLHGYTRDYCPEANAAIAGQVPSQLMEYLQANRESLLPETLEAWKNGRLMTAALLVSLPALRSLAFTSPNLRSSYPSLTKALTVLIARRSSSTTPFRPSTVFCRTLYIGATRRTMAKRPMPSRGVMMTNMMASSAFIEKEKKMPSSSIIGDLTRGLKPLLMAFCITVISPVSLVTIDDVSNLSIFGKAYSCIRLYSACLILAPQP